MLLEAMCIIAICEFKLELQSEMLNSGKTRRFFGPSDLEILQMT